MSMKSTPRSTARRSTLMASSRSAGGPQMPGPVMRIAPYPRRWMVRSPITWVPLISTGRFAVVSLMQASVPVRSIATAVLDQLGLVALEDARLEDAGLLLDLGVQPGGISSK